MDIEGMENGIWVNYTRDRQSEAQGMSTGVLMSRKPVDDMLGLGRKVSCLGML